LNGSLDNKVLPELVLNLGVHENAGFRKVLGILNFSKINSLSGK
jgi:hypothetical protein